jgi:hypothetical protein
MYDNNMHGERIKIEITLFQIVYIITLIPDKKMIDTCLRYLWPCIRWDFLIWASKFLTVFPRQLCTSPGSVSSSNPH